VSPDRKPEARHVASVGGRHVNVVNQAGSLEELDGRPSGPGMSRDAAKLELREEWQALFILSTFLLRILELVLIVHFKSKIQTPFPE
jgi:hypothetical protein